MRHLLFLTLALTLAAGPAHAAPIIGAISGVIGWLGSSAIGSFLLRTAVSFGLSALARALAPRQGAGPQRGVETKATTSGGTQPQTVIFGRYATGGNAVAPPMTHGRGGSDVVEYLNYVFDISDYRISSVDWVYIDGEKNRFVGPNEFYGTPAAGSRFSGHAWLRWYNGTQTAADAMLVSVYDEYTRPWTEDHVLTGVAYAVLTFRYSESLFQGFPQVRFEVRGAPLYDPRKDSSVGGVGPQRWADQDTWAFTENPVVMVYNILRGLPLADGSVYGLGVSAEDLPIGRWVAAMNVCDELVPTPDGLQPRYRCGLEFSLDMEPLDVIDELLRSCGGQVAESGGMWNVSVGPAPFPVASFTDESVIVSDAREHEPFRGLNETFNGIHASYLNPDQNWQGRDEAPYYRPDLEAEDGGRRLIAELRLPTVTERRQVQRLMQEMLLDNRRMRTHVLTLPPTGLGILPLDTISWTSDRFGYQAQLFEVQSKVIDPATLNVRLAIRERDPSDYSYDYDYAPEIPDVPGGTDPGDGAPETPEGPVDDYLDPITNLPLDPEAEAPVPGTGDLVALHPSGLNRSTDGGANWTYVPTPISGGQDLSVLRDRGFLVLAATGAHFSSDLRAWNRLSFTAQAEDDIGLVNGDFETGTLAGWTLVSGSAQVLDTSAPAQQGGTWYLTGTGYVLEQVLDLPAWNSEEVVISADAYAAGGSTATLSVVVSEKLPQLTGNGTWTGNTIVNYATAPNGAQLDLVITSGGVGLTSPVTGAAFSTLELRYTDGTPYVGPWVLAFRGMDGIKEVGVLDSQFVELLLPPGTRVKFDSAPGGQIGYDGANGDGSGTNGNGAMVVAVNPASVVASGTGSTVAIGPGTSTAFYNTFEFAPVTLGAVSTDNPAWETIRIKGGFQGKTRVRVRLEGTGTEAYFDNVRAFIQTTDADQPQAVATDHGDRRHLVACRDGLHAVDAAGVVTPLGELPFAPSVLAVHEDTILIAATTQIGISEDNGATWTTHTAGAVVRQVFATPAAVAVLSNGEVVSVSAGGLTSQFDFAEERWLAHARRPGEWLAVDADGDMLSGGLTAWSSGVDQPVSNSALPRRVLALEAGRRVGWVSGGRDIFYRDLSAAAWSVGWPLVDEIRAMKEVK